MRTPRFSRRRLIAVSAAALAAGPSGAGRWTRETWRGYALGADARITLSGPPDQVGPALRDAVASLRRTEALYSLHDSASLLSRLNATGALIDAPADFTALLHQCGVMHALTGGLFDPTVQPLWRALFTGADPDGIDTARALIGWGKINITGSSIHLAPGQALTLNGIAQGAAADAVVRVLRTHGIGEALVNTGEMHAIGGPWRIGIADPASDTIAPRQLRNAAIATSSPGALRLGAQSKTQAQHILAPRPGRRPPWSTLSVEAESATIADAASTAGVLMTQEELYALAQTHPEIRRVVAFGPTGDITSIETPHSVAHPAKP